MKRLVLAALILVMSILEGCGGSSSTTFSQFAPRVTLSASTATVTLGSDSIQLTWSSTNANSCKASATPNVSDWTGALPTSGSALVAPTAPGTTIYSVQCIGASGSASKSVSVLANVGALGIASHAPPTGTVGKKYNPIRLCNLEGCYGWVYGFQLAGTGGVPPYVWTWAPAAGSSLPPGLLLDSTKIEGTPTKAGSYIVAVTVSDSQSPPASVLATYTITINNPPAPTIDSTLPPSAGALNLPYSFVFAGSGYGSLTWSETGALPPGLNFSADGSLTGKPTHLGSYPITLTLTDSLGQDSAPYALAIAVYPDGFKAISNMVAPRVGHTATLLNTGKVLVTGGMNGTANALPTTELFDPATSTFASASSMASSRTAHTATLLKDGKVLVIGGVNVSGAALNSAELYDPATGMFQSTGNLSTARAYHVATLLSDGRVLVTGGENDTGMLPSAELYDAASGTFSVAASEMTQVRRAHGADLLIDGRVLITGGDDGTGRLLSTAELFDPVTNAFSATGSMSVQRRFHTSTVLKNGEVLVTGGADLSGEGLISAELYDALGGTSTPTKNMGTSHGLHTAVLLNNGAVLVVGGGTTLAELFDASSRNFSWTGSSTTSRTGHTATLLSDGSVLVTGGVDSTQTVLANAELYQ